MENLKLKLCPLPKAIHPLHPHNERQEDATHDLDYSRMAEQLVVSPVVHPGLAVDQHEGLLRVARHLKLALEARVAGMRGRSVDLRPSFFLLPNKETSLHQTSRHEEREDDSRPIDTIGLMLVHADLQVDETMEGPATRTGFLLQMAMAADDEPESYTLRVDGRGGRVEVAGRSCRGVFYGVQTLIQLLCVYDHEQGPMLPLVSIADQPDFAARGVMLDVSRDKGEHNGYWPFPLLKCLTI